MINIMILSIIGYYGITSNPSYRVGQCFYLIDPETGEGETTDVLKIDKITRKGIHYRWWVLNNSWAVETNYRPFKEFKSLTKPWECPNE